MNDLQARDYLREQNERFKKTMAIEMKLAMRQADKALNKMVPKVPNVEGDGYDPDGNMVYDTWICPCCEKHYEMEYEEYNHCPECGQAIDWNGLQCEEDQDEHKTD